jgi:hypothetical protein
MSAENQESRQYPVDAIHYYPKEKRLVFEVEGGVTFALTQSPEGLLAQLLLSEAASQRAAIVNGENPSPVATSPAVSAAESEPQVQEENHSPPPAAEAVQAEPEATTTADRSGKKENQLILTGKLKTKPAEGRYPDKAGRPTATALFAANAPDREDAWMLSATFLRATVKVALALEKDDQITVEGFVNKNNDPTRNDYYSIYRFLHHSRMPAKTGESAKQPS